MTLGADGKTMSRRRQRPGHPRRRPPQDRPERAGGDLHHPPRRRQVRQRRLQGRRRPARRRRQRGQRPAARRSRPRSAATASTYTQSFRRGKPLGPVEPRRAGAGDRHDRHLHARPRDLPRRSPTTPTLIAERLDVKTYLNKGLVDPVRRPEGQGRASSSATTAASPTSSRRSTQARKRPAGRRRCRSSWSARTPTRASAATSPWPGPRRPTRTSARSSTRSRPATAAPTSRGCARPSGAAVRRFMDTHELLKKGIEIKAEDIREGLTAVLSICIHEPQFQGQTKGRLNNPEVRSLVESIVRPRARRLPAQEQERRRRDRRPGDPGGQGPRGQPGRRLPGPPQDGDLATG